MKKLNFLALLAPLTLAACGSAPSATPTVPAPTVPDVIRTYAVTDDSLYSIVLKGNSQDEKVMTLTYSSSITDAARVDDIMYASTFSSLLRIDLNTKAIAVIGNYGVGNINALATDGQGKLYASGLNGRIYSVDTLTGSTTQLADMGLASSGDLAFAPDGMLYATVKSPSSATDLLARINLSTKLVNIVGNTGYKNVFGLDYLYGTLYGRTNSGQLLTFNTTSGQGVLVRDSNLRFTSLR